MPATYFTLSNPLARGSIQNNERTLFMTPQDNAPRTNTLGFIGFGEVGMAFAAGLRREQLNDPVTGILAFDIKTCGTQEAREEKLSDYESSGVLSAKSAQSCAAGAQAVFSLVTADQALDAALSTAPGLGKNCLYLDCNSCAPDTKKQAAIAINAAGGRYVDVAIMAPVHPDLHKTPTLVSGKWAEDAHQLMMSLGMRPSLVDGEIGAAASIKLIRSIMVKGMEALLAECLLAGTKAGVAEQVLKSLEETYPDIDWEQRSKYALSRMIKHGMRRAAEMEEATSCVKSLRLPNQMSRAAADWQRAIAGLHLPLEDSSAEPDAKRILTAFQLQYNRRNEL